LRELPYIIIGVIVVGTIATCGVTRLFGGHSGVDAGPADCFVGSGADLPEDVRVSIGLRNRVEPIGCDRPHTFEVYHRGRFTGTDAKADSAQAAAGSGQVAATCDRAARDFLGDDYAEARVRWDLIVPDENGWRGGDRSYACVMAETAGSGNRIVDRTGSLRDGLRGDQPMGITCVDVTATGDVVISVDYIRCDFLHGGEFVGAHPVAGRDEYPGGSPLDTAGQDACPQLAASYLGLELTQLPARKDLTVFWIPPTMQSWTTGDRSIRCYVGDKAYQSVIRGSVKAIGVKALPS
jgi:hypothetical protein